MSDRLYRYETLLGNLWSPMRSSAPDHNNLLVRTVVSMFSHSVLWRAYLKERMRLFGDLHRAPIGVEATSYMMCCTELGVMALQGGPCMYVWSHI